MGKHTQTVFAHFVKLALKVLINFVSYLLSILVVTSFFRKLVRRASCGKRLVSIKIIFLIIVLLYCHSALKKKNKKVNRIFNPLSAKLTNCLSVLDHFVGLAFEMLKMEPQTLS